MALVPEALVNNKVPRLVVPDTCNEDNVALVPLALPNLKRSETQAVVKVAFVPEAPVKVILPNDESPLTCKEVRVALVPLALVNFKVVAKRLVPVALVKVRLVMVEEGVLNSEAEAKPDKVRLPLESSLNLLEEFICKLMKSPLKVGLLKPRIVPEAEPPIKEN